ncbi:hypothetical protein TRAPUB_4467 [Trametes pubescens]|uniref:Uncharacterized protein n=1 Tax=Trametes pubescens TaxID=154538 RepID=A0A1M2VAW8_TRAPU|nr:hypothetical protein TRAPUB_4467 [Trametes pubescens]
MTSMDVVSNVADATFDVVAPVADVPPSVDSTTLNHADSLGEFSANSEFEDSEEDDFIPRGGDNYPSASAKRAPAPPKAVGKLPKTPSSTTPQNSTKTSQSAKASQAKPGSKSTANPPSKKK